MRRFVLVILMALALLPIVAQAPGPGLDALLAGTAKEYSVVKGETLKAIAAKQYGDYHLWPILWFANRDAVKAPDAIEVGQKLSVYKLPFALPASLEYGPAESAMVVESYMAAYRNYVDLGGEWANQRRWVLLEALPFDPAVFVTQEAAIELEDLQWFAAREGRTYEPKQPEAVAPAPEPQTVSLTFLETTDVHGSLFPYNFITAKPAATSLAQISTLVKQKRAEGKELVLLEDGDSLQGQPTVYYYNFVKTDEPHIWGEVLNYLGYDALGVGNHDIEAGHIVYDKLYQETMAPVLCANAIKDDGEPYFTPYTVIERGGVKIAVLGMISPKIPDWLPPQFWTGMTFQDMVECAKKWVPIIQDKEKPDLLVGLFHAGVDYTYGGVNKDTPNNENAAQLVAERVPGFDMIFAGHDHQGWDGLGYDPATKKKAEVKDPTGKTVYIYGGLNAARSVPVVEVTLSRETPDSAWTKVISGSLVPIEGVAADPDFIAKFQGAYDRVKDWVSRPVGKLAGTITTRDSMFGDSAFVDLIHRIQLELSADPAMGLKEAQVSFGAPLTFDATIPTSPDGTMYVRDMFSLYQYENFLYTMDMTGKQIKDFLEYSYKSWFATMPNDGNHIINFTRDAEGKLIQDARTMAYKTATASYNYDSAAGINYTVDITKPAGERIAIESMADGSAFELDKSYVVAINSYRGSGGGGHLTTGAGLDKAAVQKLQFVNGATTKDLRFYLLTWFEKQVGAVTVEPLGNWKVIPEDLAAQGREVDFPLLYPPKK
jgi:2',3'-cyclic-nucleotide 2'-phosphodiesterase/3'-nucleotidase